MLLTARKPITPSIFPDSILELTGKTSAQLDEICSKNSQQLVADMQQSRIHYNTIAQPNFFEAKAAELLEQYADTEGGQVQQILDVNPYQPIDLSEFDTVKNYAYPVEVKYIEGKPYSVHRNCTEVTKLTGYGGSQQLNQAHYGQSQVSLPISSSVTTITRKKTVRDWLDEPKVVGYNSVVNVNPQWSGPSPLSQLSAPSPGSSSSVEIRRFNKTITRHPDGTTSVGGSESQRRWQDGKLVLDQHTPFGQASVPRDEQWKRAEREHLFWYLTSPQSFQEWESQQEDRLIGVASTYHITLPILEEFHRRELSRYQALANQYQSSAQDSSAWQKQERGRLDWLIHQNGFNSEDFDRWQRENEQKLAKVARQHGISRDELQNWQREELRRLHFRFNQVNESLLPRSRRCHRSRSARPTPPAP